MPAEEDDARTCMAEPCAALRPREPIEARGQFGAIAMTLVMAWAPGRGGASMYVDRRACALQSHAYWSALRRALGQALAEEDDRPVAEISADLGDWQVLLSLESEGHGHAFPDEYLSGALCALAQPALRRWLAAHPFATKHMLARPNLNRRPR